MPYSERVSTAEMVSFRSGIIDLQMRESENDLVPIKYTLVCCMPALAVFGHTMHYLELIYREYKHKVL